jgi:hypothetical protein
MTLCRSCVSITLKNLTLSISQKPSRENGENTRAALLHSQASDLNQSAKSCPLCALLAKALWGQEMHDERLLQDSILQAALIGTNVLLSEKHDPPGLVFPTVSNPGACLTGFNILGPIPGARNKTVRLYTLAGNVS